MSYKPSHGHRKIELAFHAIFNITHRIRYHGRREKEKRNSRFFFIIYNRQARIRCAQIRKPAHDPMFPQHTCIFAKYICI